MNSPHINISITPGTIVTVILSLLLVAVLWQLRELVFIVLTAIVIASAIEPAVYWLTRYGIPRVLGVLVIYLSIFLALVAFFYFFIPPLLQEAIGFIQTIPQYFEAFAIPETIGGDALLGGEESPAGDQLRDTLFMFRDMLGDTTGGIFNAIGAVFGGLLSFSLIVILSFYFAVRDTGIDDFLRVVTPAKHQDYMIDLWRRSQRKIGRWMQGQLLLSLIIGVLVYIGLSILGVRYALLLAIVAAVFDLIPVIGSILAAVPAVAIALIDGGTSLALLVIVLYIIANQLQSNVVHPIVVQKIVGVPPLLVILAVIAGYQIAGFLGIILAVPVAATIQEFVSDLQKQKQQELVAARSGTDGEPNDARAADQNHEKET